MSPLRYSLAKFRDNFFFADFEYRFKKSGKIPPPKYILWDCTRRCNLNCLHCGASKETYSRELSTQEIKSFIDQLARMKVRFFAATGGEPLLRSDILEVLAYATRLGVKTGFATNGFFIDEDKATKIKKAGISSIQVSLDGPEHIHNSIRGNPNSYKKAVEAIQLLQKEKIPIITVATTISSTNYHVLPKLKEIIAGLNTKSWRIAALMPIGRGLSNNLGLSREQFRNFLEWVAKNNSRKLRIELGENLSFLGPFEKKIRKRPLVCHVGFSVCCMGVDGHIRGCPEQPDIDFFREGSIKQQKFQEIWENGFKKYRLREILAKDTKCSQCKHKTDCYGGCWVMRQHNKHCIYDLI